VTFTPGTGSTTGTVSLTAYDGPCGGNRPVRPLRPPPPCYQSTGSYNVVSEGGPPPIVDLSPFDGDNQDMARCAASCFAATYAQSTVPYFSLDTPRNITLAYHGDRVAPQPFVQVNVMHGGNGSNLPNAFYLKVKKADGTFITFLNGEQKLRFAAAAGSYYRLAGQFDAAANGMGSSAVYAITIVVGAEYASGNAEVTYAAKLMVVSEAGSPIARGWTLAGIQRLYIQADGSALVTDGSGSAVYFLKNGGSFIAPAGEFSTLALSTTYKRTYPDSTRVTFDANTGRMTQITDPFGNVTAIGYDGNLRVSQVTDPVNHTITLGYGSYGLASITDPGSRQTSVTVDASGRLTAIADPDQIFNWIPTTFGYDASLRLSSITDRRGSTTTLGYDIQSGKLASVTDPAVPIYGQGTVSPATTFAAWQKVSVPYSSTTSTPFTPARADTVRGSVTDPGSHQTRFTVNGFGQPLQSTGPLGDTVTVVYNTNGQPLSVTDRLGVNASYTYDATGFLTSTTVAGIQTFHRNGGWAQADSVWGAGLGQRMFLGQGGRTDSVRVGAPNYTTWTRYSYDDNLNYSNYASHSRLVSASGATSPLTIWYMGWYGNRSKVAVPGGRVTSYNYNAYGLANEVASSNGAWQITAYDLLNRPDSVMDGQSPRATVYTYDSLFLRSVRDPKLQVYQLGYNALGWVTSKTDPTGNAESFQYDADGLLRQYTNRRGQTVNVAYDALHRRTTRTGAAITPDTMSYASDGHTVTASNAIATETAYLNARLQADSARTTLWIPGGGSQSYLRRYWNNSANAQLDSMRSTGGGLANFSRGYAYNAPRGTLDSIRIGIAGWTRLIYGANLSLQKIQFPGTASDTLGFDYVTAQDLAEIQSPLLHDMVHYDSVGHMDELRSALQQWTRAFTYDTLGQLRSVSYSNQVDPWCYWYDDTGWSCTPTMDSSRVFSYDPVGNRTDLGGTYLTGNRISSFNGCNYGTDADGNVTSRSCDGATFGWSADGRLDSLAVGGTRVNFQYDASGRLVRRDVNGAPASYFLWDGDNLLAELGSDAWSEVGQYSYYPGLDRPHTFIQGGQPLSYFQQDALGNVRFLGIDALSLYASYQYDERGQVVGGSGNYFTINRAQWKGALALAPEAGLYFMRARWYEPQTGRFLSEDPMGLAGGINPYVFAGNDPISGADPTGLQDGDCPWWKSLTKCAQPLDPIPVTAAPLGIPSWAGNPNQGPGWNDPDCHAQMSLFSNCQISEPVPDVTPQHKPSASKLLPAFVRGLQCGASSLSFASNLVTSGLVFLGGGEIALGVVGLETTGFTAAVLGASTGTEAASAWAGGLLFRGATHAAQGALPGAVTGVGVYGDAVRHQLSWKSLVPVIGLPSAYEAVAASCAQ
jgi:RHS repeat-associated protein